MRLVACLLFLISAAAHGQTTLKVSALAWSGLSAGEKAILQSQHYIETVGPEAFGTIIDNQAVDRSTPGTNSGAALGGLVGGAAYIDRSFKGNNNYSALTHLGVALLGGMIGSALDRPAQALYQFRYAVRLGSGAIVYQDAFSGDAFRHPVGICVSMPTVSVLAEQHLCTHTTESLRGAYLLTAIPPPQAQPPPPRAVLAEASLAEAPPSPDSLVTCRLKNLAPTRTTADKCTLVNGVISE